MLTLPFKITEHRPLAGGGHHVVLSAITDGQVDPAKLVYSNSNVSLFFPPERKADAERFILAMGGAVDVTIGEPKEDA